MRSGNPRLPRQVLVEGTAKASEPDYAHASPFSVNSQPCFYVVCNLRCMNNLCNHKQACKSPFGVCFFTKEIFLLICISSKSLRVESPAEVMGGTYFWENPSAYSSMKSRTWAPHSQLSVHCHESPSLLEGKTLPLRTVLLALCPSF